MDCQIRKTVLPDDTGTESPVLDKTDEDISLEFIDEFHALCKKYGRTFVQGQIKVVKI